jgi:hypothetical protein
VAGLFYDISTAQVLRITSSGISHLDPLPSQSLGTMETMEEEQPVH